MYDVYCNGYKLGEKLSFNCITCGSNGHTGEVGNFPIDEKVFMFLTTTPLGIFSFPHEMKVELYRDYKENGFPKRKHYECTLVDITLERLPYNDNLYLKCTAKGDLSFVFEGGK